MMPSSQIIHEKLLRYKELLHKWNKSINLFSRKLSDAELDDHISDCAFLADVMNNEMTETVLDFGSGNGMPGIILGIYGFKCVLVERNKKKGSFLREMVRLLELDATVVDQDINDVFDEIALKNPKVIVSKAVAKVSDVITICSPLITSETRIYLLKNSASSEEFSKAEERYKFTSQMIENKNLSGKVVMKIFAVEKDNEQFH